MFVNIENPKNIKILEKGEITFSLLHKILKDELKLYFDDDEEAVALLNIKKPKDLILFKDSDFLFVKEYCQGILKQDVIFDATGYLNVGSREYRDPKGRHIKVELV